VQNELGVPVAGAQVVVTGASERVSRRTDQQGRVIAQLRPRTADSYEVTVDKLGFARTMATLPVWTSTDTTAPVLVLDAPALTSHNPVSVSGQTEPKATLTVNGANVAVDAEGYFSANVTLVQGDNVVTAVATNQSGPQRQ
jgi:hypothetical protein